MTPAEITSLLTRNASLTQQVKAQQEEIQQLRDQLVWLKRRIFGTRSERFVAGDSGQTELDLGVSESVVSETTKKISYERRTPAKVTPHGREELPAHLPRREKEIPPDVDVSGMDRIGEKRTEKLCYTPASLYVEVLVRGVFAGERDGERVVVCAELPPDCNEKGKLGASMIAHAVTSKFEDHLPMYRLREQIKRDGGVDIAESILDRTVETAGFWLEPIAKRLEEIVLSSGYVQMDESTIRVMIKPTCGKSTTGRMWLRHSPEQNIVLFDYDRHRSAEVAQRLLDGYRGILQTDGYVVYDEYSHKPGVIHAGCNAHARRKFDESLGNDKDRATFALDVYRELFAVEQVAKDEHMAPPERLVLRKEQSVPLLDKLKDWLDTEIHNVRPKGRIGQAILYCLGRWVELTRFTEDGRIEISTNLAENRFRPFVVGRKNWLFAGNESAARRMATIYTVQGTCKLLTVNFREYLTAVLDEIPKRISGAIDDLLPMNWKPLPDSRQ